MAIGALRVSSFLLLGCVSGTCHHPAELGPIHDRGDSLPHLANTGARGASTTKGPAWRSMPQICTASFWEALHLNALWHLTLPPSSASAIALRWFVAHGRVNVVLRSVDSAMLAERFMLLAFRLTLT